MAKNFIFSFAILTVNGPDIKNANSKNLKWLN